VRRIVVILLTLVLAPSIATASWYRCAYDGKIRSACCCPTKPDPHEKKTPPPDASVRAACCCTVTHITSRAPAAQANPLPSVDAVPTALAAAAVVAPSRAPAVAVTLDRPRAQGDPPDTLFARRCSLLL
jgi:hypothetical protein